MDGNAAVCLLSASFQLPETELPLQQSTAQLPEHPVQQDTAQDSSGVEQHTLEPRKRLWVIRPAGPNTMHHCCDCRLRFRRLSKLIAHVLYKHDFEGSGRTGKLPCPICQRRCRSQGTLAAHLGTFLGERTCKKCHAQFASAGTAMAHKYFHLNAGHFKCGWCVKRFARLSDLNEHSCLKNGQLVRGLPSLPKAEPCMSSE